MAITASVDPENNIVCFKNSGHRSPEAVALALSTVTQQYEISGKVLLLIDWSEYQGQVDTVEGLIWQIAKLSLMVERVALIAGENMKSEVERWIHQVDEVLIRHFVPEELADARTWLINKGP